MNARCRRVWEHELFRIFVAFYALCLSAASAAAWMLWPVLIGGWWLGILAVSVPTGIFGLAFSLVLVDEWA